MTELDLFSLDRKIALSMRALDGWRTEIAVDGRRSDEDVLAPWVELTKKTTLTAIAKSGILTFAAQPTLHLATDGPEVPAASFLDPNAPLASLREGALRWCGHLYVARAIRDATALRAGSMRDDRECDAYGREISLRAMLRALARPKQAGGVPEGRAAPSIEDLSVGLLDSVFEEENRRGEVIENLGLVGKGLFDFPEKVLEVADRLLAETEDEAKELLAHGMRGCGRVAKHPTWVDTFFVRRAADVAEGWPSALSARWLAELSRGTELLAGLQMDVKVDAGRLSPHADFSGLRLAPPTGAWTFAKALFALGVALRIHGRDATTPFCAHGRPYDLRPPALGEAFYALAERPIFHARARGVSSAKATQSAKRLRTTRLLEQRHLALRVKLYPELLKGRRPFLDAFEGHAEDALLGEISRDLAAFLGAPGPLGPLGDAARLCAIEQGETLAKSLRDRFDDDWWRNPKAATWIRGMCAYG